MRKLLVLLVLAAAACRQEPAVTETVDTRGTIEVGYVGVPEMQAHAKPDDASPVVTKLLSGESVSVVAKQGGWVEIRTAMGSAWIHASDLTTAAAAKEEEKNPNPKFRVAPSPVTAPGTRGSIYIEGTVNSDGEITSTKVLSNTTNSESLAERNAAALRLAKFYPIVQKGVKKGFLYYYRVDY